MNRNEQTSESRESVRDLGVRKLEEFGGKCNEEIGAQESVEMGEWPIVMREKKEREMRRVGGRTVCS